MSAFADSFPKGQRCVGPAAPTGEPFTALQDSGYQTLDDAEAAARKAFDEYAKDRTGVVYWRTDPETAVHGRVGPRKRGPNPTYAFYMRLLISDKGAKS